MNGVGRRGGMLALMTLALLVVVAATAAPAGAVDSGAYDHDGASCFTCHPNYPTIDPPADTMCTGCHSGGFESRQVGATTTRTCWTCHDPGQDMTAIQGAGCGSAAAGVDCHNTAAHFGSNTQSCTSCHGVTPSATDPGTSAHHGQTNYTAPATCTDCHTQANGLHAELVSGVACATCHGGFDATHPEAAAMVAPTATLTATPAVMKYGLTTVLAGSVKSGATGVAGKTVTLQQKPAGSADFATVTETTTGADGSYSFAALSPTKLTTYRIVAQGAVVNATVVKPALKTVDVTVKPVLTIALSKTKFALGGKVTIKGALTPARPGGVVKLTIQRKVAGVWKTQLTKSRTLSATSAYSYTYKPLKKGSYRVKAAAAATPELLAVTTAYKTWVVK